MEELNKKMVDNIEKKLLECDGSYNFTRLHDMFEEVTKYKEHIKKQVESLTVLQRPVHYDQSVTEMDGKEWLTYFCRCSNRDINGHVTEQLWVLITANGFEEEDVGYKREDVERFVNKMSERMLEVGYKYDAFKIEYDVYINNQLRIYFCKDDKYSFIFNFGTGEPMRKTFPFLIDPLHEWTF